MDRKVVRDYLLLILAVMNLPTLLTTKQTSTSMNLKKYQLSLPLLQTPYTQNQFYLLFEIFKLQTNRLPLKTLLKIL